MWHYQFFYGFEQVRDTWEDPYDLMNEMDAFMCALYALHEIFIPVWYSWLYIRGLKKHRFCEPTSMSQKCVATHQMCYLFICNLKTNQTFHHPSMDMDEQNRMGTSRYWCLRGYYNRGLTDLVEEVGSDDSSNEESGMHADLIAVSGSDSD